MLTNYQKKELVFGSIFFIIIYTFAYSRLNEMMDISTILFTTGAFIVIYWLSISGATYFTYNVTQSLDTPVNGYVTNL